MSFHLADLLDLVVSVVPDRTAVVCGDRRLDYRHLRRRSGRVAAGLRAQGIARGDHVALALRNGTEYLEAMWGAFWIGAIPVNANPRYVDDELAALLADAEPRLVIAEADLADRLARIRARIPSVNRIIARGDDYERWLDGYPTPPPTDGRSGDDRYVLYTGGTTGSPKGVVWRHEDLFFGALGGGNRAGAPITRPQDLVEHIAETPTRTLPASPLAHGTAHWLAFNTLFAGGTVVLSADRTFSAHRLLDLVATEEVSHLVIVGDAFGRPLADALRAEPDRWDLSGLTTIVSGGATLTRAVRRQLLDALPWTVVVDGYGTSETGGQATRILTAGSADPEGPPRFVPGPDTAVLDEQLRAVAPGSRTIGRIARRGRLPLGYHRDPERSAEVFRVVDGVRWALTGDHARVEADGTVALLGRGSSTINSGGEKVHAEEVEGVLTDHPSVADAVVVGVPDPRWGERVAAVVALVDGATEDPDALVEHCRSRLAGFKIPRTVVVVDAVARLATGKPDHRWARDVVAGR